MNCEICDKKVKKLKTVIIDDWCGRICKECFKYYEGVLNGKKKEERKSRV